MTLIFLALLMYGGFVVVRRVVGYVRRNPAQAIQLAAALRKFASR